MNIAIFNMIKISKNMNNIIIINTINKKHMMMNI